MTIRKAKQKDIPKLLALLSDVLEIHAKIRPDIFISGTTKYTKEKLQELLENNSFFIYVCVDELDSVFAYAFCKLKEQANMNNMVQFKSFFIDDLCVEQNHRGQHVGTQLFNFVKSEAKRLGCYEIVLNVWQGNEQAKKFYEALGFRPKEIQMEYILDKLN